MMLRRRLLALMTAVAAVALCLSGGHAAAQSGCPNGQLNPYSVRLGTAPCTAAAGNDPRILGALQMSGTTLPTSPLGLAPNTIWSNRGVLSFAPNFLALPNYPVAMSPWNNGGWICVDPNSTQYPTSPVGLNPCDIWSDGGLLVMVPGSSCPIPSAPTGDGQLWSNGLAVSVSN